MEMGVITSQKISTLYERYKTIDVTFTREIIQVTGLITNQVFLKCVGDFRPCVIYSSSFQGAKIVVNTKSGIIRKMEQANNMASLRFSFMNPDTGNPVTFFVNSRAAGTVPYGGSSDMEMLTLQFTQRPPDDLIEIMGRVLDANINSAKRKEERIQITPDSLRRLNLQSKESVVFIQGVPRRCIMRDLSFSGAKVIMVGVEKFLINREVALRMDFQEPRESLILKGKFIRSEQVEGRKELIALALVLDEAVIPMGYKIRINDFISLVRADTRGTEDESQDKNRQSSNSGDSAESEKTENANAETSPEEANKEVENAEVKNAEAEKPAEEVKPAEDAKPAETVKTAAKPVETIKPAAKPVETARPAAAKTSARPMEKSATKPAGKINPAK